MGAFPVKYTLLRLEQDSNATPPMLTTPLPIVTLFRPAQSKKVSSPMSVTLSGIVILVRLVHPMKAPGPIFTRPLTKVTFVRPLQSSNAYPPSPPQLVRLLGIVTLLRL